MSLDHIGNPRQRSLPILVVENDPDHHLLIAHSLRVSVPEAVPTFLFTAQEALAHLDQCENRQAAFPRLVLLDIHLPQP